MFVAVIGAIVVLLIYYAVVDAEAVTPHFRSNQPPNLHPSIGACCTGEGRNISAHSPIVGNRYKGLLGLRV
jgi:hypothetical protein